MDSGECSNSTPSSSSPPAAAVWARLVPADSAYPAVAVAEEDAVVCSLVAPAAGGEELAWCEIRRGGDASSATIRNLSSDAIIVDGRVIQQEVVDIKPGSEIVPGPQKEGHLAYTFDITASKDHNENNVQVIMLSLSLLSNGCFSEWLRRSSSNSRDKSQSAACPQCRTAVQSVGRNHFLHNIEAAILKAFSSLQRSDEEIALLESYASVKSNIVLGNKKNQSRKRPLPRPSDESNDAELPCPQCGTEFAGFRCNPGAAHLQCSGCGGMMPARPSTSIQQKCLGCDGAFCGAYWYSQGVNSRHRGLICNPETFRMISQHHISRLPDTLHGGNPVEKDITERCIQQSGKTLQAVISEWIAKFDNKELDRSRLQLNNVDAVTSRTYLCNHCYNKFVDFLLYWFRVSTPRNLLPPDAASRDSCWYGFMCRTQHHRPDHARKLNHVCRPTRNIP
ncbi:uncharacterized protein [Lolium perenne]|uniref:uncharacterized protein isoform X2 n=1 Tax=Lolium perenne TaxID=4522 RepID=UPI0021F5CFD4|nr:uncharacterized protein LOC127294198 isoform X2 [Lolium perenne]